MFLKRMLDVVVSIILVVVCLPLLMLIALSIKIFSANHILSRHPQVRSNGESFDLLKFNATVTDGKPQSLRGLVFQKLSYLLRRTSIDELPTIFNVLKGQMSFFDIAFPHPS